MTTDVLDKQIHLDRMIISKDLKLPCEDSTKHKIHQP